MIGTFSGVNNKTRRERWKCTPARRGAARRLSERREQQSPSVWKTRECFDSIPLDTNYSSRDVNVCNGVFSRVNNERTAKEQSLITSQHAWNYGNLLGEQLHTASQLSDRGHTIADPCTHGDPPASHWCNVHSSIDVCMKRKERRNQSVWSDIKMWYKNTIDWQKKK